MIKFWHNKIFTGSLLIIFLFELLSFFNILMQRRVMTNLVGEICIGLIFVLTLIFSIKNLKYGIWIAFGELLIGSLGQFFAVNFFGFNLSVRVVIFLAVILAWVISCLRNKKLEITKIPGIKILGVLAVIYVFGLIWSYFNGNSFKNILLDANSWIYFAYLPVAIQSINNQKKFSELVTIFWTAIVLICSKILILLYFFSHNFDNKRIVYQWIRDSRFGEITLLSGNIFRIFSQSQIYILIALLFLVVLFLKNGFQIRKIHSRWLAVLFILLLSTTLISLSRSNWLGLLVASLVVSLFSFAIIKIRWQEYFSRIGGFSLLLICSLFLLGVIIYFPIPQSLNVDTLTMLEQRFTASEVAVSSRSSQLQPLSKAISKHLIIGSGWGSVVTYNSQDPRVLTDNPDGQYSTYAFEWGYLDIILKIGLVGIVVYLLYLIKLLSLLYKKFLVNKDYVSLGLLAGLIAIMVVHVFSPYLNHPLGIGYLVFVSTYIKLT